MSGRARHSVRAARGTDSSLRRARSDAPYPASLATGGSFGMKRNLRVVVLAIRFGAWKSSWAGPDKSRIATTGAVLLGAFGGALEKPGCPAGRSWPARSRRWIVQ